ncbi:hypothetical protein D3C79_953000 [compost metagenome]
MLPQWSGYGGWGLNGVGVSSIGPDITEQKIHQPRQPLVVVTAGQEFAKLLLIQACDHNGELAAA